MAGRRLENLSPGRNGQGHSGSLADTPTKKIDVVRTDTNSIAINIVGAGRGIETTECGFEFVKSIVIGYGYTISPREIGIGTIRIGASKRSG